MEDEHTLLFTFGMNVRGEVKNVKIKNLKKI